jgi:hypothetical protein
LGLTTGVRRIRDCGGRPGVGGWSGTGKVGGEPAAWSAPALAMNSGPGSGPAVGTELRAIRSRAETARLIFT